MQRGGNLFSGNYLIKSYKSMSVIGLQVVAKWITKCVRYCRVWQRGLQSTSWITKFGEITKQVGTIYVSETFRSLHIYFADDKSMFLQHTMVIK